jgi:hypothetical protein
MTDARHPEQREGSSDHGTLLIPEIPHVVLDDGHLKYNVLYTYAPNIFVGTTVDTACL